MGSGKLAAQVAHASMSFLTKEGEFGENAGEPLFFNVDIPVRYHNEINTWLKTSFRKICLGVDSLDQLQDIKNQSERLGLLTHLVVDNGTTVFNNIPTPTCLAIGPHYDDRFLGLTEHLKLLK